MEKRSSGGQNGASKSQIIFPCRPVAANGPAMVARQCLTLNIFDKVHLKNRHHSFDALTDLGKMACLHALLLFEGIILWCAGATKNNHDLQIRGVIERLMDDTGKEDEGVRIHIFSTGDLQLNSKAQEMLEYNLKRKLLKKKHNVSESAPGAGGAQGGAQAVAQAQAAGAFVNMPANPNQRIAILDDPSVPDYGSEAGTTPGGRKKQFYEIGTENLINVPSYVHFAVQPYHMETGNTTNGRIYEADCVLDSITCPVRPTDCFSFKTVNQNMPGRICAEQLDIDNYFRYGNEPRAARVGQNNNSDLFGDDDEDDHNNNNNQAQAGGIVGAAAAHAAQGHRANQEFTVSFPFPERAFELDLCAIKHQGVFFTLLFPWFETPLLLKTIGLPPAVLEIFTEMCTDVYKSNRFFDIQKNREATEQALAKLGQARAPGTPSVSSDGNNLALETGNEISTGSEQLQPLSEAELGDRKRKLNQVSAANAEEHSAREVSDYTRMYENFADAGKFRRLAKHGWGHVLKEYGRMAVHARANPPARGNNCGRVAETDAAQMAYHEKFRLAENDLMNRMRHIIPEGFSAADTAFDEEFVTAFKLVDDSIDDASHEVKASKSFLLKLRNIGVFSWDEWAKYHRALQVAAIHRMKEILLDDRSAMSSAQRLIVKYVESTVASTGSLFAGIRTIDPTLSLYGNMKALNMMQYWFVNRITSNLEAFDIGRRCAMDAYTPEFTNHNHLIYCGKEGLGKSMMLDQIGRIFIQGSVTPQTDTTSKANNVHQNFYGMISTQNELSRINNGLDPRAIGKENNVDKEILGSGFSITRAVVLNRDTNSYVLEERRGDHRNVRLCCTNDYVHLIPAAMRDRYLALDLREELSDRKMYRNILPPTLEAGCDDREVIKYNQSLQALVLLANCARRMGIFGSPDLSVASVLCQTIFHHMSVKGVDVNRARPNLKILRAIASEADMLAITRIFLTDRARYPHNGETFDLNNVHQGLPPFDWEQLLEIEKFSVSNMEMTYFIFLQHRFLFQPDDATKLRPLCSAMLYYLKSDQAPTFLKRKGASHGASSEDYNYLAYPIKGNNGLLGLASEIYAHMAAPRSSMNSIMEFLKSIHNQTIWGYERTVRNLRRPPTGETVDAYMARTEALIRSRARAMAAAEEDLNQTHEIRGDIMDDDAQYRRRQFFKMYTEQVLVDGTRTEMAYFSVAYLEQSLGERNVWTNEADIDTLNIHNSVVMEAIEETITKHTPACRIVLPIPISPKLPYILQVKDIVPSDREPLIYVNARVQPAFISRVMQPNQSKEHNMLATLARQKNLPLNPPNAREKIHAGRKRINGNLDVLLTEAHLHRCGISVTTPDRYASEMEILSEMENGILVNQGKSVQQSRINYPQGLLDHVVKTSGRIENMTDILAEDRNESRAATQQALESHQKDSKLWKSMLNFKNMNLSVLFNQSSTSNDPCLNDQEDDGAGVGNI